jgi:hypothetical protein
MSEKMSKWDWVSLGLQAATFTQAMQAQNHLASLNDRSEMENVRKSLLELFRNYIFEISRDIKSIGEKITDYPQQAYIVSSILESRLKRSGLTAEFFPDFQDKEYVLETEKRISSVLKETKKVLSDKEIEESALAVDYITEMPVLQEAITTRIAQAKIKSSDEEWEGLKKEKSRRQLFILFGILCFSMICVLIIFGLIVNIGKFLDIIISVLGFGSFFGGIVLIVLGLMSNPRYKELKKERDELISTQASNEIWQQITSLFGNLTLDKYKEIYHERISFLNPLIGGYFGDDLNI